MRHPRQSVARVQGRLDAHRDVHQARSDGGSTQRYVGTDDPLRRLHEMLGLPWPCAEQAPFPTLWNDIESGLRGAGVRVGLASYRGWNDGDRAFAAATWCAVRHQRPAAVVETGVAHGLTSRVVLEGLERNGNGRLHSVDLPAIDPALHKEIGVAVPDRLRPRWTYVAGTSRQCLRGLVQSLPGVDLFIHDSLHTQRNMRFELEVVWPRLREGAIALVDDIDRNPAFAEFAAAARPRASFAAHHVLGTGMWGVLIKDA
ncbi:MAG TPA: class I SAM-dependent methyltransferase [Jatrophihabitans sp.]